ncbi:hypothetical protein FRX31_031806 [Thalictrum thalictroides]|uniref:U1-type domain-containing protein n=1 Tax=Thalictrum thalictroides TaxID=46969 RepID=A0A7J6V0X3_THATH|nr:hypothetical protein FRX31_031806 [Thalictrum thalictroides]
MEKETDVVNDSLRMNIMPLDLAIKRELAYRAKIKLQLNSCSDLRELPTCFQGSSSSLAGKKRKMSSSIAPVLPNQLLRSSYGLKPLQNLSGTLFCQICNVPCSGLCSFKQHLAGKKHAACVQEIEAVKLSKEKAIKKVKDKWDEIEWDMV